MIEIKNVTKIYPLGKKKALDNVSFEIPEGIFGLIGRNGAGKTTIMRIIATVMDQTDGAIYFDGKELKAGREEFRKSLGYLPQSTKLMPRLNIVEFLDYVCIMKGIKDKKERRERIAKAIETVGLVGEEKKRIGNYSGGMLRRAGIAQAIIDEPKVLIIDEPTTGLDPEERLYFLNLLSRMSAEKTIIFSTHIIQDIENICQNIAILEKGKLVYTGNTKNLLDSLHGKTFGVVVSPGKENEIRQNAVVTSVTYSNGEPYVRYICDEAFVPSSEPLIPTLEDACIYTLGGTKR